MDAFKLCLSCLLLALLSSPNDAVATCRKMKEQNPKAPSGTYVMLSSSGYYFEVYCEMGLNGGGYTFLSPAAISRITTFDISQIFTNKTSFLMRIRRTDGTQPYAVLRQLSEYASIPLKVGLSECAGYRGPSNIQFLGLPYLYFGFVPVVNSSINSTQGLEVNGVRVDYTYVGPYPNSQITLFPDFSESVPTPYTTVGPASGRIFSSVLLNPSGRVMPPEYFMFAETQWGRGGCCEQTNQLSGTGVLAVNIGFQ